MDNNIVVRDKTEIAVQSKKTDILSLYGVPSMLDKITQKEKSNLLNKLNCGAVLADSLNKLAHSDGFFVEIPKGLRQALEKGEATLDKSGNNPGSFTPNIRVKGKKGIQGQVTISKGTDSQAVTQSLSNLAMMSMVQSVLEKMEVIEAKLDDIKNGQKNDRIGKIIGSFKAFMDLYPTFKSQEDLDRAATIAFMQMHEGLAQLHLQIDEERRKLSSAPSNGWSVLLNSMLHIMRNDLAQYRELYNDYVYDLQLYNRLILLSDVVVYLKGDSSVIQRSHSTMQKYCQEYLDVDFRSKMKYIMHRETTELENIDSYNQNLNKALEGVLLKDLHIECKKEDVKYLKIE